MHVRKERAFTTAVVMTTAVVIGLAVLQYRWSNQVSEATSVRLADTLQLSMINWHLDLLRNFTEISMTMRVDRRAGADADLQPYVRQFGEWKTGARYPDLVDRMYVLKAVPEAPEALLLNPSSGQFEPEDWSLKFRSWHLDLQRLLLEGMPARPDSTSPLQADAPSPATVAQPFPENFVGAAARGWRFEPSIPALVHAMVRTPTASTGRPADDEGVVTWLVIELSDVVIQNRILPDLAHRYFQGLEGLDYDVAVATGEGNQRRVLYTSSPGFGESDMADVDGTMNVFGRVLDGTPRVPIEIFHRTSEDRRPANAIGIAWFPLLREVPEGQDWQLVVRHRRGGPLSTFVTDLHRRDLLLSFGALLLLAVSMGMLIVTSTRAQRLAKLQMDFVTAVSHELRTPLTVISSAADNIAHGVVQEKNQLTEYGSVISHHARQLSGLLEQVLLFASTNEDRQRHNLQPLDVSEIVDATMTSTEGLIRAAHFTVERDIEPGLPKVTGDLLAVSQCLQNLITNALKYGREQRWIGIRAKLAGAPGSREVQISITDRGMGIASGDLQHIFEPFYRSPSVKAAQIHGTGLGLSLAKRIADAMMGRLTVTSEPGRGSTFTLHLPCVDGSNGNPAREPSA